MSEIQAIVAEINLQESAEAEWDTRSILHLYVRLHELDPSHPLVA